MRFSVSGRGTRILIEDYLEDKFSLSPREVEVVMLVSRGFSNREVADELFVCEKTIKFHLTNIYKKMDLGDIKNGIQVRQPRNKLILWINEYQRRCR